jgi:hypothetical protein
VTPSAERRRVGDIRSPWFAPALAAASLVVFANVLSLTSYRNFFYDEWSFVVSRRTWNPLLLILPHGNHWSTIPILVWKLLFVVVGLRSHVPYEAALLVVHVVAVVLLFLLIRRQSGDLPAFAAALTLLVLGSGADDIVWAFQIAWVGSVAFGLLAMMLADRNPPFPSRVPAVSAALLGSLMCSSVGIAFVAALGAELAFDRSRRRFLLALVVPIAAFTGWFLAFDTGHVPGSPGVTGDLLHGATGLAYLASVAQFVIIGLEACAAGIFGVAGIGIVALPILALLIYWRWLRQKATASWQVGMLAGLLVWFPLVGLGRVQLGLSQASQTRYVYVGIVFLLPLVAHAARDLPWRGAWRPTLTVLLAVALLGNFVQLRDQALSQIDFMRVENAELQTVEVFRAAPDLPRSHYIDDAYLPQLRIGDYLDATNQLGSPVPRAMADALKKLPAQAVNQVMLNLFGDALTASVDSSRSSQGLPCTSVDSSAGTTIGFQAADGKDIMVTSSAAGAVNLWLWYSGVPPVKPLTAMQLEPSAPEWVHLPNTSTPIVWQVQIDTPSAGQVQVCGTDRLQVLRSNSTYRAQGSTFTFGRGWLIVADDAASNGSCVRVAKGTRPPNGAFGGDFMPALQAYDVWYRVRVTNPTSPSGELTLTLTDATASKYITATTFSPNAASTAYTWLRIASNVTPPSGHRVRFQINVAATLTTDWYIDAAAMVPAGSAAPVV